MNLHEDFRVDRFDLAAVLVFHSELKLVFLVAASFDVVLQEALELRERCVDGGDDFGNESVISLDSNFMTGITNFDGGEIVVELVAHSLMANEEFWVQTPFEQLKLQFRNIWSNRTETHHQDPE